MEGVTELLDTIDRLSREAPSVLADAINHTSHQARQAAQERVTSAFDNPSSFTKNAFAVQLARAGGAEPAGSVFVKDTAAGRHAPQDWLRPQEFGGTRELKDSERKLQAMGILPPGMYTVPGQAARLNGIGNISSQHVIQLLWSMRRQLGQQSRRHRSREKEPFFVMYRNGRPIGIAERKGGSIGIVLAFVSQPTYSPRLEFLHTVTDLADRQLAENVDIAIAKLL